MTLMNLTLVLKSLVMSFDQALHLPASPGVGLSSQPGRISAGRAGRGGAHHPHRCSRSLINEN